MENDTQGKCTCICSPPEHIDAHMVINLPEFHAQVKNNLNGNKSMKVTDKQLKMQVATQHGVQFMDSRQFADARRSVQQYLQTVVVNDEFLELPVFLNLLIEQNKRTTTACLQTEHGNNTFLR